MDKWGSHNSGLYATHIIERAINVIGDNVIEIGAKNGRLTNWFMDIGIQVISYDKSQLTNGRMREGNIIICPISEINASGDICIAFDILDDHKIYEELHKNFKVIIGNTKDRSLISKNAIWLKGHNDVDFFISGEDKDLLSLITDQIVIDYLVVGRFGVTPSVRKMICALRNSGYKINTTLPRTNGSETYEWLRNRCRIHNVLMNNTADWEWELKTKCKKDGVPVITFEDGFIPHYSSFHFDRKGFCWNSSVPFRSAHNYEPVKPPSSKYDMKNPGVSFEKFVFVPLQTRGDSTILHGSDIVSMEDFVRKLRKLIPEGYGVVIKNHPKEKQKIQNINGVQTVDAGLGWLLKNADVVAGINSTVLLEASLVFNKPTYYFGKSWYDNHPKVCRFNDLNTTLEPYKVDTNYRQRFWSLLSSMQYDYTTKIDGHEIVKKIKTQLMPYKKYAISIVTFGDEYEHFVRCFDSIIEHTPDLDQFNFIIGCNDVSDRIRNYIRSKMLEVDVFPIYCWKNIGKANMTQKILLSANSDYLIHFDDDTYVLQDWSNVLNTLEQQKFELAGKQYGVGIGRIKKNFLRLCKWYNDCCRDDDRLLFITGSFYCANINFLLKNHYPDDRLFTKSDDVMMGPLIKSKSAKMINIAKTFEPCIKQNTSKTHRGIR